MSDYRKGYVQWNGRDYKVKGLCWLMPAQACCQDRVPTPFRVV
jgi:hypothetical protein